MSTSSPDRQHISTRHLTRIALLLAMALSLSILEGFLPPLPAPVPIRYGLSNIAVMATLLFIGRGEAVVVALLKSVFVVMTRGLIAGLVSFFGTLLSVLVMVLLDRLSDRRVSIFLLSVSGAICHNLGQFFVLIAILSYPLPLLYLIPLLILFALLTGLLSASLLYAVTRPLAACFEREG